MPVDASIYNNLYTGGMGLNQLAGAVSQAGQDIRARALLEQQQAKNAQESELQGYALDKARLENQQAPIELKKQKAKEFDLKTAGYVAQGIPFDQVAQVMREEGLANGFAPEELDRALMPLMPRADGSMPDREGIIKGYLLHGAPEKAIPAMLKEDTTNVVYRVDKDGKIVAMPTKVPTKQLPPANAPVAPTGAAPAGSVAPPKQVIPSYPTGVEAPPKPLYGMAAMSQLAPDEQSLLSQAISDGRLDANKVNSRTAKLYVGILKQNPNMDMVGSGVAAATQKATESAFAKGMEGRTARSIGVAFKHIDTAQRLFDAMDNGSTPAINAAVNEFSKVTGKKAVPAFESVRDILADEIAKGVIGGQMALDDRVKMAEKVRTSASPEQMKGVFDAWKELMGGQATGLEGQYYGGFGKRDFRRTYTTPELAAYMNQHYPNPQRPEKLDFSGNPAPQAAPQAAPKGTPSIKFKGFK